MTADIIRFVDLEVRSAYTQLVSVYRVVFTQPTHSEDAANVQDLAARFPYRVPQPGWRDLGYELLCGYNTAIDGR